MEINEKKLTDEKIIKILGLVANDKEKDGFTLLAKNALDLIYRLQDEKQKVIQDYYAESQHCDQQKDIIAKQKDEIERLTEENAILKGNPPILAGRSLGKTIRAKLLAFDKMKEQNAELQKQVDVLTAEKENLYFLNKNLEDYIDNHEPIWKRNTEQAVKDTAKEIYSAVLEFCPVHNDGSYTKFIELVEDWLKHKYGVEVE